MISVSLIMLIIQFNNLSNHVEIEHSLLAALYTSPSGQTVQLLDLRSKFVFGGQATHVFPFQTGLSSGQVDCEGKAHESLLQTHFSFELSKSYPYGQHTHFPALGSQ